MKVDVTDQVDFGNPDDEALPLRKCVCGQTFGLWDLIISIYEEAATECPHCHRKFIFSQSVRVYQVE